ncbi:MAG: CehA/McbA family metallohydrolase [Myxococcaceae bacterium]|nr:CehA/McbA family metallohydrolase [Myxococcaceae bacterium]
MPRGAWLRRLAVAAAVVALAVFAQGCKVGCVGGEASCKVEPPCPKVTFTCDTSSAAALSVGRITDALTERPSGSNALASNGDYVLENAFTRVVIANVGNQNYLDPNGGSLLDLTTRTGRDGVNQVLTVVGLLPQDAAKFESIEIIDERPARVAIQARGFLDRTDIKVPIYTRYELTPCDRGVRMRTEILNPGPDNQYWGLTDGFYWSKREPIPFTPGEGQGFTHPSFGLTTVNSAFQTFPYLAFNFHNGEAQSYAAVSCTGDLLQGFNSDTVSTGGLHKRVVPPRGWLAFDRFLAVADALDVDGAGRIALDVRTQVAGEKLVKLTGRLERGAAVDVFGTEASGNVVISEGKLGDPAEKRVPWSQVLPSRSGAFEATVPAGKSYVVEVHAFGRLVAEKPFENVSADTDLGTFAVPSTATVRFEAAEAVTATVLDAEIFLTPFDDATKAANEGTFHGQYGKCTPWLGAPPGPSPACNRVLLRQGVGTAEVPAGRFRVYAFHGPFWSLGHQDVTFLPGEARTLQFQLTRLPLQPAGTVSADLHVHGAASFDSMIPDYDRVLSFAASDLDVIITTDHEVVYDYSSVIQQLGLSPRMSAVSGVETTAHIPWLRIPDYGFPLVIGHYIFWPLPYDITKPRNGAPFDELIEPGQLMENADDLMTTTRNGVFQLNHPWAAAEFGRDLGFPRSVFMDLTKDLPATGDKNSSGNGIYVRTPEKSDGQAARFANDAHHVQEVMNGSQNDSLLQYRHFWFYLLNQGRPRTGTANSDTHSLVDSTVGMPRNIVYVNTTPGPGFDLDRFNTAVKGGRVLGTSAPIIEATVDVAGGGTREYGLTPFRPLDGGALKVKVTSAPWATVSEVRVVVNGKVVKTLPAQMATGLDPFGTTVQVAFDGSVPLSELLDGVTGDAWVVVEASRALPLTGDLGGGLGDTKDGMPDTTDNNGDGVVDMADVAEGSDFGPLSNGPFPKDTDPGFHFANITDNGFPFAYTNPFLLDRDGNSKFDAPGVNGGR